MTRLAWSWSRLNDFEKCPKQLYWKSIAPKALRCPFVTSPAMERGKLLHKSLENAVQFGDQLHPEVAHVKKIVDAIREEMNSGWVVHTEQQRALTEDLNTTTWFAKNVWLRVIYDVIMVKGNEAKILDWKTGKNSGYTDQLAISAFTGFVLLPPLEKVTTSYIWVDHKATTTREYHRGQYEALEENFRERSEMIQICNDSGEWPAKPSNFNCRWCSCTKSQCEFSKQ